MIGIRVLIKLTSCSGIALASMLSCAVVMLLSIGDPMVKETRQRSNFVGKCMLQVRIVLSSSEVSLAARLSLFLAGWDRLVRCVALGARLRINIESTCLEGTMI
jgi:hypothetical protein